MHPLLAKALEEPGLAHRIVEAWRTRKRVTATSGKDPRFILVRSQGVDFLLKAEKIDGVIIGAGTITIYLDKISVEVELKANQGQFYRRKDWLHKIPHLDFRK